MHNDLSYNIYKDGGHGYMRRAIDFAKIFIKRGLDTKCNTYDGNMKLQKLLFFANFISIAGNGKVLFREPIRAFSAGCVVEEVRLRYKNDYVSFCRDSEGFEPNLSQEEYDVINLTAEIFGHLSARELSDINHSFSFWKKAVEFSEHIDGFKDKNLAIVSYEEMLAESANIKEVVARFKANRKEKAFKEIVNDVTFYFSTDIEMTDDMLKQLENFSRQAEDNTYTVYNDDGNMVIS